MKKTIYCICYLGYSNNHITDFERDCFVSKKKVDALEKYEEIISKSVEEHFADVPSYIDCIEINLEQCVETDDEVCCLDVLKSTQVERQ